MNELMQINCRLECDTKNKKTTSWVKIAWYKNVSWGKMEKYEQ
jgi:hypothetical protein